MARKEKSLQYELCSSVLPSITNDHTKKAYKNSIKDFARYCKTEGITKPSQLARSKVELLQKYEKHLEKQGYSAATIHTKLAGVCRALDVKMDVIQKPVRECNAITKGREEKSRAAAELEKEKFSRSVALAKGLGVRRAELKALKTDSLTTDESGYLCVIVESGKGGKRQLQRILPGHEKEVQEILAEPKGKGSRVLAASELGSHINYHAIRREIAREAYKIYCDRMYNDPFYRVKLKAELVNRYKAAHPSEPTHKQALRWYHSNIDAAAGLYILRGSSRTKAEKNGRPVVYDRLALLAVSVFHLSHWRLDVTVTNYLI